MCIFLTVPLLLHTRVTLRQPSRGMAHQRKKNGHTGETVLKMCVFLPAVLPRSRHECVEQHGVRVLGGDIECPLQVCQLGRSSERTHFLSLRRDVALFVSTRAPDGL